MDYLTATQIKPRDIVLVKSRKYKSTCVLKTRPNKTHTKMFFQCVDGTFTNEELCKPMPHKELEKLFISDPDTEVFVNYNDEAGVWQYSVQVVDSNGYWLNSYKTLKGAEQYIARNNLRVRNE